jgi:hypothetical protein
LTAKLNVPLDVGVPLRTPSLARVRPGANAPETTDQEIVALASDPVRVCVNGTPTAALLIVAVVIVGLTPMVASRDADNGAGVLLSVARSVKSK